MAGLSSHEVYAPDTPFCIVLLATCAVLGFCRRQQLYLEEGGLSCVRMRPLSLTLYSTSVSSLETSRLAAKPCPLCWRLSLLQELSCPREGIRTNPERTGNQTGETTLTNFRYHLFMVNISQSKGGRLVVRDTCSLRD